MAACDCRGPGGSYADWKGTAERFRGVEQIAKQVGRR